MGLGIVRPPEGGEDVVDPRMRWHVLRGQSQGGESTPRHVEGVIVG